MKQQTQLFIDLHVHSTCSDGTVPPEQLPALAARQGLCAMALTDHDTLKGLESAGRAAAEAGIELVPGIEISCAYEGRELHMVALDVPLHSGKLQETLDLFHTNRDARNEEIMACMRRDGISVSGEDLRRRYKDAVITRAHLARFLMETGRAASVKDAFDRYLSPGCRYYVPRKLPGAADTADLIRSLGAIPVLAHPYQYAFSDEALLTCLRTLRDAGLIGTEAYYSTHSPEQTRHILAFCRQTGLLPSGGSDFHGANKPDIQLGTGFGGLHIPLQLLQDLRGRKS